MVELIFERLTLAAALFFVSVSAVVAVYALMAWAGAPRVLTAETQVVAGITAVVFGLFCRSKGGRHA